MRISDWSSDVCSSDLSGVAKIFPRCDLTRMELPVADASVVKGGISRYMRQGLLLGDPTAALADDHGEFRLPIRVIRLAGFEDRLKMAGERVGVAHEHGGLLRRDRKSTRLNSSH